jgi:hypothetical protein
MDLVSLNLSPEKLCQVLRAFFCVADLTKSYTKFHFYTTTNLAILPTTPATFLPPFTAGVVFVP